jgi:ATPase family AAA domain-containing protein 3A/B
MSWLFGVGPKQPTQLPQMPSTSGGDGPSADGSSTGKSGSDGGRMAYSFDSTALERAAKAAQDLEKSKYAKEALDLSKQQEHTRQLEYTTRIKELEAAMEQEKVGQFFAFFSPTSQISWYVTGGGKACC